MLGTGAGSEIRQPLGYAIVGGLMLSQILTLFTTPVVYLYLDRLGGFLRRERGTVENSSLRNQPRLTHGGGQGSLNLARKSGAQGRTTTSKLNQ